MYALRYEPWLGDPYQFYLTPFYSYQHYPTVHDGFNPTNYSSTQNRAGVNAHFVYGDRYDIGGGIAFNQTRRYSFNFESVDVGGRILLFDESSGDICTLTLRGDLLFTTHQRLHDPTTPYHGIANLEVGFSVGKEFMRCGDWQERIWGYFSLGQANKGYPWFRGIIASEYRFCSHYVWNLFADGYFGFGENQMVNVNRFNSYADIRHQSIDIGTGLSYIFQLWGKLSAYYSYRIFAERYPAKASTVYVEYQIPISIL